MHRFFFLFFNAAAQLRKSFSLETNLSEAIFDVPLWKQHCSGCWPSFKKREMHVNANQSYNYRNVSVHKQIRQMYLEIRNSFVFVSFLFKGTCSHNIKFKGCNPFLHFWQRAGGSTFATGNLLSGLFLWGKTRQRTCTDAWLQLSTGIHIQI